MSHSLLRKTGAGALAAVLVLGLSGGAVRAETPPHPPRPGLEEKGPKPAITRDEALARVKQYFAVPSEGVEIQIQLSKWARNPRWEIEVNDGRQYHQLASVDAVTGRVLSYSAYRPQSRQIYEGAIPVPAEGVPYREQAEALVKALAPAGVFERLRPAEETLGPAAEADGETHLGWVEYRNGAAVPFSSVSVTIDNATMAVVSYYYNVQDGVEYADGPAVITAKQARELLSSAVTPRLVYVPITDYFYDQPVRPEMKLQYWFPGAHRTLDALTGDLLGYADKELETTAADAVPAGAGAPVKAASLPLQEEEAMRLTRTLFGLSDDTELQIYGGKGRGSISVNWEGGSVAFSRETGLIQFA
ncbi:MAG TPA: PepSY domain-containing protein, partial [Symbiobacteriaceae bacterium]|nr:PepSY domain-containing protein [Symbiobacteriaceae bacterium]